MILLISGLTNYSRPGSFYKLLKEIPNDIVKMPKAYSFSFMVKKAVPAHEETDYVFPCCSLFSFQFQLIQH